jgi:iron complex transport system substrate-binding protein
VNLSRFNISVITLVIHFFILNSVAFGDANPKKFTDETKRVVTIKNFPPKRIISLSPAATEILFAIGLDEEIVGVTRECDYPKKAEKKTKVGEYMNFNLEAIVSLKPDLIIMAAEGNVKEKLKEFERLGLTVYTVSTKNILELLTTIKDIGSVTRRQKEGEALAQRVEDEIDAVQKRLIGVKKKTVFCIIGIEPLIGAGSNTLIGDIIKAAGGINIIGEDAPDYPVVGLEELYVKNPDVILISSMGSEEISKKENPLLEKFSKTYAAKRGAVFVVDSDILCRPSYRIIDAIKDIAKKIHPEIFIAEGKK